MAASGADTRTRLVRSAGHERWILGAAVVGALVVTAMVPVAVVVADDIAATELLGDPAEVSDAQWFTSAHSSVNLLVWAAALASFGILALALRSSAPRSAAAMAWLGALTGVLLLDDLFVVHEVLVPDLVGVPQAATVAVYAVALLAVILRYRTTLLAFPEASLLVLAAVGFGGSVLVDLLGWDVTARRVVEEGLKLMGTMAWFLFPARILVRSAADAAVTTRSG